MARRGSQRIAGLPLFGSERQPIEALSAIELLQPFDPALPRGRPGIGEVYAFGGLGACTGRGVAGASLRKRERPLAGRRLAGAFGELQIARAGGPPLPFARWGWGREVTVLGMEK